MIANAICDATGACVRELPITPEQVLQAMESPEATPISETSVATPVG